MKYFFLLIILLPFCARAQYSISRNQILVNYLSNPANVSNDTLTYLNFMLVQMSVGGDKASLHLSDLFKPNTQMVREKIIGIGEGSTGFANLAVTGPSIFLQLGNQNTLSVTTRGRVFANYWDVDGRLTAEVEETERVKQTYPYLVTPGQKMMLNANAWSELGLGFSRILLITEKYIFKGGINVHYLTALAHSSYDVRLNGGSVGLYPPFVSYITDATGTINAMSSGALFNSVTPGNLIKGRGSFSYDIGFIYKDRPDDQTKHHFLKLGISVTDIGKLSFSPDTAFSKAYNVNIKSPDVLYFAENLKTPFNQMTAAFDRNPNAFTRTAVNRQKYHVTLPTMLRIFGDYQVTKNYGFRGDLALGLTTQHSTSTMRAPSSFTFTPHYEKNRFSALVPFSIQDYTHFNAGLAVGMGGFYIGSGSLFSALLTPSKRLDFYAGLTIALGKNRQYKTSRLPMRFNGKAEKETEITLQPIKDIEVPIAEINQDNTPLRQQLHSFISLGFIGTTNNSIPLWLRSRQYGSTPLSGLSGSIIGGIQKGYDPLRNNKLLDWGGSGEVRLNGGNTTQAILVETYVKARLSIFQFKVGRSKDFVGLVDSTLSSGAFAVSGNALGIPKLDLSIPEYWPLPYTHKLVAIKGNFSHGWMGDMVLNPSTFTGNPYMTDHVKSYFHQLSVYGRLGKPDWSVKWYGGLNHQVIWGNESQIFPDFGLSKLQDFFYVVTGKKYGTPHILSSKIGNHLGSIDQGIEISIEKMVLTGYHQFFYDVGALASLANAKDGIWGISLKNYVESKNLFVWKKFLVEFILSKSQGGEPNSVPRASPAEDYYNNYLYHYGWSYMGENIGNPLFTSTKYIQKGLPSKAYQYYPNNRITAIHAGAEFVYTGWNCKTMVTFSTNYGSWQTAPETSGPGGVIYHNDPPYFQQVNQLSGYFEANRPLKNGYALGFALAADQGKLLNNSVGGFVKITKSW